VRAVVVAAATPAPPALHPSTNGQQHPLKTMASRQKSQTTTYPSKRGLADSVNESAGTRKQKWNYQQLSRLLVSVKAPSLLPQSDTRDTSAQSFQFFSSDEPLPPDAEALTDGLSACLPLNRLR